MTAPSTVVREAGTSKSERRPTRRRLSWSHVLIGVVAVLAFALNFLALRDRDATVMVAVAAEPLVEGSVFGPGSIRLVPILSDFQGIESLIGDADIGELEDFVFTRSIAEGEVVTIGDLARPGLPSGNRSMSLPVSKEHAAGGSLADGDRVDVISVSDGVAVYVATDIAVIGVAAVDDGSFNSNGYHVVVAVTAQEALRLAEALDAGSLEVIRSTGAPAIEFENGPNEP
jgi:Flp pilus assembly protein CpaB